ncbi:bifunctional UDP-sugar hydrolase/5'-nucleotidase [Rossellomorea aquimaris]|uniref:2',3'-cyclic-nucleotide 2'-phosphodiesterase (5'-nucleotidase family) n=1 Tax=Rossellomorea aquimaris TaxID=189382 RepID=A0A366EUZ4_9BACI|nr:bifunctional UDP-sugar hydrolase/5'-nucleotidase [Rossellomorea aquimaris]RBP06207.1 2',3'-cyclic-nucleotide 2'-phosphodiesterase (5'-nucleotidase family) [Rossellomorea aquimaris]
MNKTITILHTNDLHGNYDLVVRQAAYIKKRVRELKAQGESYLLLEGGDHMDMSINECLATNGQMHLEMLADVGYHAMSVGNNELLRSTPALIRKHSRETRVPWLLSNLVEGDGTPIGGVKETLLVTVDNGVKVGLFGATDQFGDLYENKHGFRNLETLTAIKKAVADLKEQGADIIVFLSHLGHGADMEMAKEVSGLVDVIVGAHSHTVLQSPVVESGVLIVQAGSHGQYVGELKMDVHIENGLDKIESFEGKLVEITPESEADASMEAILEKGREETNEFFSEVLYTTREDLTHADIIQFMAEAVRDYWKSEIGIMYGGAAVDQGLQSGDVTKGDVYNRCKSMHSPVLMELKGEQIARLIEDSFNGEVTSKQVYGNGFRPHGIPIGALGFSGVTWSRHDGVISDVKVNGEGLVEEKVYLVGTGSPMLYEEVCGYASVKGNKLVEVGKTEMVKDVFMNYLRDGRDSSVMVNH